MCVHKHRSSLLDLRMQELCHVYANTHASICARTCISARSWVHMHAFVCECVCVNTCMCGCACGCTHACPLQFSGTSVFEDLKNDVVALPSGEYFWNCTSIRVSGKQQGWAFGGLTLAHPILWERNTSLYRLGDRGFERERTKIGNPVTPPPHVLFLTLL